MQYPILRSSLAGIVALLLFSTGTVFGDLPWVVSSATAQCSDVRLKVWKRPSESARQRWVVVTHGMNGTVNADRFHRLGESLGRASPEANIVLVDWSNASISRLPILGLPDPVTVAKRIPSVGRAMAAQLQSLGIAPEHTLFVGESFGVYVNAVAAQHLGGVDQVIAMNPATELAGFAPPDLRKHSRVAWSFHTSSVFDTRRQMAHRTIAIATEPTSGDYERHTSGIRRFIDNPNGLCQLLHIGKAPIRSDDDLFDAEWTQEGRIQPTMLPRIDSISREVGEHSRELQMEDTLKPTAGDTPFVGVPLANN
ncbi:MAG: hypothetical protein ACR2NZ_06425 [Rubripirellula sp.]